MQEAAKKEAMTAALWEKCKERLSEKIPGPFFASFIHPIVPVLEKEDELVLLVRDSELVSHIGERYLKEINASLRDVSFMGQVRLRSLAEELPPRPQKKAAPSLSASFHPHPACRQDIEKLISLDFPETSVFVQGPSGSGKTSLCGFFPSTVSVFTIEKFITELLGSFKTNTTIAWRAALRKQAAIVIDDFQFLKKSALKSQEEIRNLFDDFQENGGKLILFSDRSLEEMGLTEDLESRLRTSRKTALLYPDEEGRKEILKKQFALREMSAGEKSLDYLARRSTGDVRLLCACAGRIEQRIRRGNFSWTEQEMDQECGDLFSKIKADARAILLATARFFGISPAELTGPARDKKYTLARSTCAYLCRSLLDLSMGEIAALLGRKDHTFAVHSVRKIQDLMDRDLFFTGQVETLRCTIFRASQK